MSNREVALKIKSTFDTDGIAAAKGYLRQIAFSDQASDSATVINNLNRSKWIGRQAQLYDKFKFTKLKFSFVTGRAKTTSGNISVRFESDPTSVTMEQSAESMVTGNMRSQLGAIHERIPDLTVIKNQLDRLPQYDISHSANAAALTELPTRCVGTVRFAHDELDLGRSLSAAKEVTVGYVMMEYTVVFYNPSSPNSA